jgi:hypothetical protein
VFCAIYDIGEITEEDVTPPAEILSQYPEFDSDNTQNDNNNENNIPISPNIVTNTTIHDIGDLLSAEEEETLLDEFSQICVDKQVNILFLTTNDAEGLTTKNWSDSYMDKLYTDYDQNIAFIIDMDNREYYINTMGNFIDWLDSDEIEEALDLGYEYVANQQYYECLSVMANYCVAEIEK